MKGKHPHGGASYRTVRHEDMTFSVEVMIPGALRTTVLSFATEAEAEWWIAKHKEEVALGDLLRRG
jgi:hypothetical protein